MVFSSSLRSPRTGANRARQNRRISHHLDSFLRSQWNAAGSLHASTTRAGYRDFTGENREKSLRYSKVVDSAQLPPIAGTAGPKRLHCFLECTGPRRSYRLKLSARQALLATRYRGSHPWSAEWSGALAPSTRGARHRAHLRSRPVEYASCNSLHPAKRTHTSLSCCQGCPCYHGTRFVFAPVRAGDRRRTWDKGLGLLQRCSVGITPAPPPRTQQAPLRALRATRLPSGGGFRHGLILVAAGALARPHCSELHGVGAPEKTRSVWSTDSGFLLCIASAAGARCVCYPSSVSD